MAKSLTPEQQSTVTVLLGAGNTIKEISKVANLDRDAVTRVARTLDIDPPTKTQKRAKDLFGSADGLTYADVANALASEGLKNDGEAVHYLTVATWVANFGWAWGGASNGDYAPARNAATSVRSRYTLRMSRTMADEVNSPANIKAAADAAWKALQSDDTRVVAVAVVKGAAEVGATDIGEVKSVLMERHGEAIRTARA